MQKLWIFSAIASCVMYNSLANAQTYTSVHTLGKLPIIKAKLTGVLDLSSFIKSNPRFIFAIKNPNSGEILYTRDGLFYNKKDGYFYQGNYRLQGYPVATDIASMDCKLTDIKAPPEEMSAQATTTIDYAGNLSAAAAITIAPFNFVDPATYNYQIITTINDSMGNNHDLIVYFIKTASRTWNTVIYIDRNYATTGTLSFDTSGALASATGMDAIRFDQNSNAKSPQEISLRFTGFTEYGGLYQANPPISDGMQEGVYSSYMIDDNGYISFNYSNGQSITFSKIAVLKN